MMNRGEAQQFKYVSDERDAYKALLERLCRIIRSTVVCRPKSAALDSILEAAENTEEKLANIENLPLDTENPE